MKILIVSGTFPPRNFGGVTASTFKLATSLLQSGHDVTVFTTDTGNDEKNRLDVKFCINMDGLKVFYFKNISNILAFRFRFYAPIRLFFHLRSIRESYDIIEIRDFRSLMSIFLQHFARQNNIPFIIQARGSLTYDEGNYLFKKFFDLLWGRKILKNATKIIAQSKTEADQYQLLGIEPQKIEIIPNWVNLENFQILPEKGIFKKKYSLNPEEKLILSLGRLNKIKGVDLLLLAFSKVLHDVKNVKLIIAGPDDGELVRLKKMAEELEICSDVRFVGPLYGDLKIAAYNDADIFVLPSKYDAFPNTVLESMACGTPVIATTGCHIADIVRENGIVIDYDSNQLKDAIITLIRDEDLAIEMGMRGRGIIFDKFNQETIIKKVIGIYQNCLDEKMKSL